MRTKRAALSGGIVLSLVIVLAAFTRMLAEPAAVVIQLSGPVQVQRAGQAAPAPASVGFALNAGDKVILGAGAKAVLMHRTGKMEPISASTTITEPSSAQPQGMAKQALQTMAQVATTNARTQPNRQGMIRPIQGEVMLISPRNGEFGVRLLDVRPTFTWARLNDDAQYIVQIRRINPAGGAIMRFQAGKDTVFHYPSNASPLIPGAEYEWTVGPVTGGRPASVRKFKIVSAEEFQAVATTLRELLTAQIDPATDGAFVLALAYRDAGLFYEANRVVEQLVKNGTKGRILYMLRGEVLDAIGDVEGASQAFKAADAEPPQE